MVNQEMLKSILLENMSSASENEQIQFIDSVEKAFKAIEISGLEIIESDFAFNLAELIAESLANNDIAFSLQS